MEQLRCPNCGNTCFEVIGKVWVYDRYDSNDGTVIADDMVLEREPEYDEVWCSECGKTVSRDLTNKVIEAVKTSIAEGKWK